MKKILFPAILIFMAACAGQNEKTVLSTETYIPDSPELHATILQQDSIFFAAYNKCDLDKQAAYYDDSIEFYHDRGGLMTSKQDILESTKKYVCGKTTRILIKGSVEVYPIKDYGAIEMGLHEFHNSEDTSVPPHPSKFIIFWQHKNDVWKIKRVVSLH